MGQKISIDSATLMNKALEIIEAHYLFQKPEHQIDVVIHPEGIVHSLVSYVDGAVMAHMGKPDMRLPIAYALFYPGRQPMANSTLNLAQIGNLRFMAPDYNRFPSLNLARECLRLGGGMPLALNAANEIAVARFIAGDIEFMAIFTLLQDVLDYAGKKYVGDSAKILPDIAAMMAVDADIRASAAKWAPSPSVHLAVAG
jgi:1-deoxy-D-xylulose-5-phosphate reductoisomerase